MTVAARPSRYVRSILFLLVALVAGGLLATMSLPVSLFPHVNFPRIRVNLDAGDRPAERMELAVTRPVELALRGIPACVASSRPPVAAARKCPSPSTGDRT